PANWVDARGGITLRDRDERSSLAIHVCFLRETGSSGSTTRNMEETGVLEKVNLSGFCYLALNQVTIQDPASRRDAFFRLFPDKIDTGSRKPDTWTWICSRVRDGNGVQTPRDVHALIVASADLQRNRLDLGQDVDAPELIGSRAIKAGLSVVSRDKIQTTLIAENPH